MSFASLLPRCHQLAMITEIAHITIDPANAPAFEAAVAKAAAAFKGAAGCLGVALERVIEDPAEYHLRVTWESVDHHMVTFRNSPAFQIWRGLVGPYFAAPPRVEHSAEVGRYF
jgi:quinol monooxygenase YgiN